MAKVVGQVEKEAGAGLAHTPPCRPTSTIHPELGLRRQAEPRTLLPGAPGATARRSIGWAGGARGLRRSQRQSAEPAAALGTSLERRRLRHLAARPHLGRARTISHLLRARGSSRAYGASNCRRPARVPSSRTTPRLPSPRVCGRPTKEEGHLLVPEDRRGPPTARAPRPVEPHPRGFHPAAAWRLAPSGLGRPSSSRRGGRPFDRTSDRRRRRYSAIALLRHFGPVAIAGVHLRTALQTTKAVERARRAARAKTRARTRASPKARGRARASRRPASNFSVPAHFGCCDPSQSYA